MPTFTIKDPDTGRTIRMTGDKPPAESDIKAAFAQQPQQAQQQSQTQFQDVANAAQNNPVMGAANFLSPAIGANVGAVANQMDYMNQQPSGKGNLGQSFQNALGATGHLASQLPGVAVADATSILGGKGIKQAVTHPIQTAQSIAKPFQLATKKGATSITTKAVQSATAAGKTAKWDDIANEVRDAVKSQYGNSVEHTRAVNKFLAQEVPAKLGKNVTKTPTELLQLRRQILARSGTGNIIQKLMNVKTTEDQVAGTARNVVSKYVHQLAPESQAADKAYTMWKKIGGSPAEWAARAAIGGTVGKGLKQLGVPESGTTDAILTLLAGNII